MCQDHVILVASTNAQQQDAQDMNLVIHHAIRIRVLREHLVMTHVPAQAPAIKHAQDSIGVSATWVAQLAALSIRAFPNAIQIHVQLDPRAMILVSRLARDLIHAITHVLAMVLVIQTARRFPAMSPESHAILYVLDLIPA